MNKQDIAEIAELLVKAYEKNLYGERKDSFDAMAESVVEKIESLEKENAEFKAEIEKLAKSDASKEQSSIEYYNLYKNLKRENAELKARLEKAVRRKGE